MTARRSWIRFKKHELLIKRVSEYCKEDAISELNVCIDVNKKNIVKIVNNRVAKTLKKIISEREIKNDKSRQKF